jgi:hypothetical protein
VFYGGIAAARLLRDLRIEEEVGVMVAPAAVAAAAAAAGGSGGPTLGRAKNVSASAAAAASSSFAWVALPVHSWADVAKGAAVGAVVAGVVSAALTTWARPR